jgi:chloride channel 3/4/5
MRVSASDGSACVRGRPSLIGCSIQRNKSRDAEGSVIFMLVVTALAKAALTTITFGLKLPAGVFLPTIAIGASFGRAVGMIMARWQRHYPGLRMFASCPADGPCISPPVYAVIGAASALGGVTRMTISLVAILFELSGAVDLTLQIMMSCMVCL